MSSKRSRTLQRERAGRRCHYGCGRPATTADHIVPRSAGGRNEPWNRVPSCEPCNRAKASTVGGCVCAVCELARFRHEHELWPAAAARR